MKSNPLIGKTITAIEITKDRQALRFQLSGDEAVIVNTDADCCSYTWIEHIELPALGFPALVTAVEDLQNVHEEDNSSPPKTPSKYQDSEYIECRQYYGCKISTDRGEIVIDYRNDSNGYYGGSLSWPDDYHYGGVYGQNLSTHDWQPVQP